MVKNLTQTLVEDVNLQNKSEKHRQSRAYTPTIKSEEGKKYFKTLLQETKRKDHADKLTRGIEVLVEEVEVQEKTVQKALICLRLLGQRNSLLK